jgi:hypothetical protein
LKLEINTIEHAVKVYECADRFQLDSLASELTDKFVKTKASEIFGIFNMLQKMNKQKHPLFRRCKQVHNLKIIVMQHTKFFL